MAQELGRYQSIENQLAARGNGGQPPTSQAAVNAANTQLLQAQCVASKSLNISVNPQFGQLNYTQYAIVAVPDKVSRTEGKAQTASTSGLTPPC